MDELTRLMKDLLRLLRNISSEDYARLEHIDLSELKRELGPWFSADYLLFQGS